VVAHRAELAALHQLAAAAGGSRDLEAFLRSGSDVVMRALGAQDLAVWLVDADGQAADLVSLGGRFGGDLDRRFARIPVDSPVIGPLVRGGPASVRQAADLDAEGRELLGRLRIATVAAVPLRFHSTTLGALLAGWEVERSEAACRLELLEAMGAHFAAAIYSHRLVADLRARVSELTVLDAEKARLVEDLRRSQEQLVHRERLAALGELAAVVAHEVRNPLGAIFNSLSALRRLVRPEGDAAMLFEIVGEEADRLDRIVRELLDFARPSLPAFRLEPLEPILEDALAIALARAEAPVEVERGLEEALPPVPADAQLVRQAFVNVLLNAVQAMPGGGRLRVGARRDGEAVRVELCDSGPGVPAELRQQVFEPFFTTRATGTGLGLAVVQRVVQDHRGEVRIEDAPGGGACFVIRLPLAPGGRPVDNRPLLG
jgi:signal transduction histidine kinase